MPRRSSARTRTRPPRRLSIVPIRFSLGPTTLTAATTSLTNLGTTLEATLLDDIAGMKITSVECKGYLQGTAGGGQTCSFGLFVGPASLDAADVQPGTDPNGIAWWIYRQIQHRGTQHNVLAAASEFDVIPLLLRTRGSRRLPMVGSTLWFAQEAITQDQVTQWQFTVRGTRG